MQGVSVLDLFVLSMVERGATTPYLLQRDAELSQGTTVPALRRLLQMNALVKTESSEGRKRHDYALTTSGQKLARTGWKVYFSSAPPRDADELVRIVDMALYYGAERREVAEYCRSAARSFSARMLSLENDSSTARSFYSRIRRSLLMARASSDFRWAEDIASSIARKTGPEQPQREIVAGMKRPRTKGSSGVSGVKQTAR